MSLVESSKKAFDKAKLMLKSFDNDFASWIDDWTCFPKQKRVRFIFSNWVDDPQAQLFDIGRVYTLELVNKGYAPSTISVCSQYAFRALKILGKPLGLIEQTDLYELQRTFKQQNYSTACSGTFWSWCNEQELVPTFLVFPTVVESRDRSFEETFANRKKKLILDEQVAAIGVAYNKLFSDEGLKKYGFKSYPKEYLAIAFSTLSLSTPSRMEIETFCLPDQSVKEHTDDKGNKSYSLFWKGSKSYPDSRTHLLSAMEKPVKRVLEVLRPESVPAKILSFFMSNPSFSLSQVMKAYPDYDYKLKEYPELDLNRQSSIFHLGLILDFYHDEPILPVSGSLSSDSHSNRKYYRRLSKVSTEDFVIADTSILPLLMGNLENDKWLEHCDVDRALAHLKPVIFEGRDLSTLADMTRAIIDANKFCNGSVDKISKGKDTTVNISDALFVYTTSMLRGVNEIERSNHQKFGMQARVIPYIFNLLISDKRPHLERSWIESALKLVGLASMSFSPHQLRHWINHHAKESGIPIEVINLWSGRKDADQAYEYIHTLDVDNAQQITSILSRKEDLEETKDIKFISIDKIKELSKLPANITSEGVCIQDLIMMPCRFLNSFMTSCFGCEAVCYIKGDEKALSMLQIDLTYQRGRLSEAKSSPSFSVSKAPQDWYKLHFDKVAVLHSLIDILTDDSIPRGSSVRLISDAKVVDFRVQNLDSGKVTVVRKSLGDSSKSLEKMLEKDIVQPVSSNSRLMNLLNKHGV